MKNWFNPADAWQLLQRLDGLDPDSKPRWGKLTSPAVLCHLADVARIALGEKTAARVGGPLGVPGIAHAVVWVMPWPRGAPTAREILPGTGMTLPGQFEADKRSLLDVLGRFTETPDGTPFTPSPVFGYLSRRAWGRLMWRHVDHHLVQFGL
jgi:hypothetical protein